MSYLKVKDFFTEKGLEDRITIHETTGDTVEHAASIIGCKPGQIGKSMTFNIEGNPIMVVCAGDMKVNSGKFKSFFHVKPSMISRDLVEEMIGHKPGAVCPFGVNENVKIYLDVSLKEYEIIHTSGGEENITVRLTLEELEKYSNNVEWIDVCVPMNI